MTYENQSGRDGLGAGTAAPRMNQQRGTPPSPALGAPRVSRMRRSQLPCAVRGTVTHVEQALGALMANGRCAARRGPRLVSLRHGYHERGAVAGCVPIAAVGDRDDGADAVARCRGLALGRLRGAPERCCGARAAKRVARRGSVLGRLWSAAGLGLSSCSVRGLRRSVGGYLASAGSGARLAWGGLLGVTARTGQGAWDCTHLRVVAPSRGIRVRWLPITISWGASS